MYPDELHKLVPEFLNKVPMDYACDKRITYFLEPEGTPVLISCCENAKLDSNIIKSGDKKGKVKIEVGKDMAIRLVSEAD